MAAVKQQVLNWLYSVLTSEYKDVNRTYNDVAQTLSQNSTLSPRTEVYTYENGRSALLLQLAGTLPVAFRGTTYRFPITLWVPHRYPLESPIVYVTPVEGMMIRPGQHVDPQGKIYHPYLVGWADYWDKSNILDFLAILRDVFAKEPPVISRQQQNVPTQQRPALAPPVPLLPPNIARPISVSPGATIIPFASSSAQPPAPPPKPGSVQLHQSVAGALRRDSGSGPPLPPLPPQHTRDSSRYSHQTQQPPPGSQYASPQRISTLRYESAPPLPPQPARHQSMRNVPYSPVSPITPSDNLYQHAQNTQNTRIYQRSPPQNPNGQCEPQQAQPTSHMPQQGQYAAQLQQWHKHPENQSQQHSPPQQKPPPPPTNLLDAPLVLSIPTQASSNLPARPIPPNPEKDLLLHNLALALQSQRDHTLAQTTSSLPGLSSQHSAMLASLHSMNAEIQALESLNSLLTSNTNILHSALHDADAVISSSQHRTAPSIDELLVAPTVVANQLYEIVSEERSLGDALFVLGRAVEKGRIEPTLFTKMTRSLAREWFLKKALVKKIGKGMGLATY